MAGFGHYLLTKKMVNNGCVANLLIYYKKNVNALILSQTRSIDKFLTNYRSEYGIRSKTQKISIISK